MLNDYILRYTETQKMPVSGFGGYAWDAMHLLAEAMQGAGGDRNKIRDNLEKIDHFPAVSGVFRFSPDDHNGLGPEAFVMVRIEGGIWSLER
jgi:branched-chain amino acid transport system substrate-binding protein